MTLEQIKNTDKTYIIGADEVGNGSLAGPLVVCGVRAPKDWSLNGLRDSKKLSEKRRHVLGAEIIKQISTIPSPIKMHIAERNNIYIDQVGVAIALKSAYVEIFLALNENKD